jgi:hypothetical protein
MFNPPFIFIFKLLVQLTALLLQQKGAVLLLEEMHPLV